MDERLVELGRAGQLATKVGCQRLEGVIEFTSVKYQAILYGPTWAQRPANRGSSGAGSTSRANEGVGRRQRSPHPTLFVKRLG